MSPGIAKLNRIILADASSVSQGNLAAPTRLHALILNLLTFSDMAYKLQR